jgi:hypothetical protein
VSLIVSPAGVHSASEHVSTGRALNWVTRGQTLTHGAASLRERILRLSIPEPNSGCWLWLGSIKENGYGRIKVNGAFKGAHRVSWEAFSGQRIPVDKLVCHKCDVPGCVNPEHLFVGTVRDNALDMWRKGRGYLAPITGRGSQNGNAKLSVDTVKAIRASVGSIKEISDRFGIPKSTVNNIITRRHWRHI